MNTRETRFMASSAFVARCLRCAHGRTQRHLRSLLLVCSRPLSRVVLLRNSDSVLECFEHSELECSRYVTEQARTESRVT
jgi:hypothetical protein